LFDLKNVKYRKQKPPQNNVRKFNIVRDFFYKTSLKYKITRFGVLIKNCNPYF